MTMIKFHFSTCEKKNVLDSISTNKNVISSSNGFRFGVCFFFIATSQSRTEKEENELICKVFANKLMRLGIVTMANNECEH